ncbi:hypothetical protein ABTZ46_23770 [Nocardioides sp. NPDC126508]
MRFLVSEDDERAYFAAVNLEQRQCAAKYGVETTLPISRQPSLMQMMTQRRYGTINIDEVARYGYELPPDPYVEAGDDKTGPNAWNPSSREIEVLNASDSDGESIGVDPVTNRDLPKGGCAAEGYRAIDGRDGSLARNEVATKYLNDAWSYVTADSRFRSAESKWSSCMKKRGYLDLKHRWDAARNDGSKSSSAMREIATNDLECALETGILDVAYAVDSAYQRVLIDRHEGELQGVLDAHREVMSRVHETLKETS